MNPAILIGAAIGFLLGRWVGLVLGALAGYWISQSLRVSLLSAGVRRVQQQFLDSTFAVMGAVCKADGRVTEDEIRVAESLFERLHMSSEARASAREAFGRGKAPGFDVDAEVQRFVQAARGQRVLAQMFLQVQLSAVAADGVVHPAEHELLLRIARGLGLSEAEMRQLEAMLRGGGGPAGNAAPSDSDYEVLGVPASATDDQIKRAYRKLMSENHPDKLAAKGLPESMRPVAEEKTRNITAAYDRIKTARA